MNISYRSERTLEKNLLRRNRILVTMCREAPKKGTKRDLPFQSPFLEVYYIAGEDGDCFRSGGGGGHPGIDYWGESHSVFEQAQYCSAGVHRRPIRLIVNANMQRNMCS